MDFMFIINMDKMCFLLKDNELNNMFYDPNKKYYEIIPYKLSFSIMYKNKLIYDKLFHLNYNLNNLLTNKKKLYNTLNYNIKNNLNKFPTKEYEGKKVVRLINKINHDPLAVRNFILSLYFLFINNNKKITWISSDYNNIKWIINKRYNNLITNFKLCDIDTQIIKSDIPEKYFNCVEINKSLINCLNNIKNDITEEDNNILNLINAIECILLFV